MSQDYHYQPIRGYKHGYPIDTWGHLLDKDDVVEDGRKARDLTSPYGALEYAIGNGNDFVCFDFRIIEGGLVVLHSVHNSETGGFCGDERYRIVPLDHAPRTAMYLMDGAFEGVRHTKRGWNQDHWFFYRDVCLDVLREMWVEVPKFSERQRRFGGKKIDAFIKETLKRLSIEG